MFKVLLGALRWAGVFGLNFGGGGGKTPANTTQTVISDVAPWAREAAKETLAKGMELTNQGYEQYGGNRLAGFNDLQNQSFAGAQNLGVAPQIGQATDYATQSGQYSPVGQQYTGSNVNQYMNPFLQGALAPQIREAASAGMMAQQQNASKAVGMGAFGGSRGALQKSLTEKNTMQNMADINARGYSDAFNQAANMFNVDQQRRIQEAQFGSNAKLNAAQALGQLGQQQFNQGLQSTELQNKFGAQQQGQTQKGLDIGYQDWMNQKNFDWDQIMRRSDLLRAVPSGSSSTTSMYKAGPTAAQNLAAAGTAAAGASQLFARGGLAYAGGGVTDEQYVEGEIIPSLSNDQLQTAYGIARQMGDIGRANAIAEVLQSRGVPVEGGATEPQVAPNSISAMATPDMVDNIMPTQESMANGGIVAFADGDLVEGSYSPGNAEIYNKAGQMGLAAMKRKLELQPPKGMTPEQYRAAVMADYEESQSLGGADPYGPMQERLKGREAKLVEQERKDKGLALLAAVPELLQGNNFAEAAGRGIGAAAKSYQGSLAENAKQRNAIEEYQFLMEDAKRKERMGDLKGARESVKAAEAAKLAAFNAERTMLQGDITGAAQLAAPFKPMRPTGGGAGSQPKFDMSMVKAIAAKIRKDSPDMSEEDVLDSAYRQAGEIVKSSGPTPAKSAGEQFKQAAETLKHYKLTNLAEYNDLVKTKYGGSKEAADAALIESYMSAPVPTILRGRYNKDAKPGTAENPIPLTPKKP